MAKAPADLAEPATLLRTPSRVATRYTSIPDAVRRQACHRLNATEATYPGRLQNVGTYLQVPTKRNRLPNRDARTNCRYSAPSRPRLYSPIGVMKRVPHGEP